VLVREALLRQAPQHLAASALLVLHAHELPRNKLHRKPAERVPDHRVRTELQEHLHRATRLKAAAGGGAVERGKPVVPGPAIDVRAPL